MKFVKKVTSCFGKFGYGENGRLYRIINEQPAIGGIVAKLAMTSSEVLTAASAFAREADEANDYDDRYHVVYLTAWGGRDDGYAVMDFRRNKVYSSTGSDAFDALERMTSLAAWLNK